MDIDLTRDALPRVDPVGGLASREPRIPVVAGTDEVRTELDHNAPLRGLTDRALSCVAQAADSC